MLYTARTACSVPGHLEVPASASMDDNTPTLLFLASARDLYAVRYTVQHTSNLRHDSSPSCEWRRQLPEEPGNGHSHLLTLGLRACISILSLTTH